MNPDQDPQSSDNRLRKAEDVTPAKKGSSAITRAPINWRMPFSDFRSTFIVLGVVGIVGAIIIGNMQNHGGDTTTTGSTGITTTSTTGQLTTGTTTTGMVSTGATTGQITTGQVSTGQMSTGQMSTGQVSTGQVSTGQVTTGTPPPPPVDPYQAERLDLYKQMDNLEAQRPTARQQDEEAKKFNASMEAFNVGVVIGLAAKADQEEKQNGYISQETQHELDLAKDNEAKGNGKKPEDNEQKLEDQIKALQERVNSLPPPPH